MSAEKNEWSLVGSNRPRNLNAKINSDVINPLPLILLILAVDLFTPLPMGMGLLPGPIRWISQAIIAALLCWGFIRMLAWGRIPGIVWLVGFGSVIWLTVAILRGQGIQVSIWGWWIMFQYPLLGLFVYIQPIWPRSYPKYLLNFSVIILGLQVILQLLQYMRGRVPGDHLSGFFGWYGTGKLLISILFVLCLALGHWLAHRKSISLICVLILGSISSALGEMKFFAIAAALLCGLAIIIDLILRKRLWMVIPSISLLVGILIIFFFLYNLIVPSAVNMSLEEFFNNPAVVVNYLGQRTMYKSVNNQVYIDIGRNYALRYAWESIRSDPAILLFGLGLGARVESRTLGVVGSGLEQGDLGLNSGTSLLVFIQELGLMGMVLMTGFFLGIIFLLKRGIQNYPRSVALELRYALLLFSLLWPLWLWYNPVWTLRVPMWLYWTSLGYVMGEARYTFSIG